MFKKLVGAAASVAMMAAVAVPALADFNVANVKNITQATSYTGVVAANQVSLYKASAGAVIIDDAKVEKVHTGAAFSSANSIVAANVQIGCSSCWDFNKARVENTTIADSQTGVQAINSVDLNRAHVGFVMMDDAKVEKVSTGPAFSKTNSIVVVNANWTPMWHF